MLRPTTKSARKECSYCNKKFEKPYTQSWRDWTARKFCSLPCFGKSRIGSRAWNKGKPRTWKAPGDFQKGHIPWNKGKPYPAVAGPNNYRWKGGPEYNKKNNLLRRTPEMKVWRMKVLVRDNFTCVMCKTFPAFVADHIKSFIDHPELRDKLENGRALCVPCHRKRHSQPNQ